MVHPLPLWRSTLVLGSFLAFRIPSEHCPMVATLLLLLLGLLIACGGNATGTPLTIGTTGATAVSPATGSNGGRDATATLPVGPTSTASNTASTPKTSASPTSPTPPDLVATIPSTSSEPPATPAETTQPTGAPLVIVGDTEFPVELALTPEQQVRGLSGRETLVPGTGMLFVYQRDGQYTFWMKEMHFPLDIVWIGPECQVVDLTLDAPQPEPGQTLDQLPRYSPSVPAQYVLEINAGESPAAGIESGDSVEFAGDLAGRYGC